MAKILLNVEINPDAKKKIELQAKEIGKVFKEAFESLNSVSAELTKQLNAVAKAQNALTRSRKQDLAEQKNEEKQQKIAIAQSKAKAAQDKASAALINAETRAKKENRLETEAERKELEKNTKTQEKNAEARSKLIERIGNQAKSILTSAFIRQPLMNLLNLLQGIDDVLVKVENRVIELRRVLNEDIAGGELSGKIYEIAQKYGQTFENVGEIVTNFARTGMTWADSVKATEAAVLALNVAELDATQASEGMIAIMTQFGISASELELVVDKLNKTSDNFPVTTEKLLVGLQRTGSAAANANLSLDQTIGLLTTLSKATGRSGANLGTAVNALIQYSTKSSALETFSSLSAEVDNTVQKFKRGGATILDVWRSVSEVINGADERQQKILETMADQEDVMNLAEELQDELGDIFEQEQEVYGTANTFRKNYFIALLKNLDTVQESIDTVSDAAGYSQIENAQYMKTYVAKVNQLKDAWESLANDEKGFLSFKKTLAELGVQLINIVKIHGGLRTVAIAALTVFQALYGQKMIDSIKNIKASIITVFNEIKAGAISLNSVLGIIGLIATAFSIAKGFVDAYNESISSANEKAYESLKQQKENLDQLQTLLQRYEDLSVESSEYKTIEEQIVNLLGEEKLQLDGLSKSTSDYKDKVIELSKEKLKDLEITNKLLLARSAERLENTVPKTIGLSQGISTRTYSQDFHIGENLDKNEYGFIINSGKIEEERKRIISILNKHGIKGDEHLDSNPGWHDKNPDIYRLWMPTGENADEIAKNYNIYKETAYDLATEGFSEAANAIYAFIAQYSDAVDEYNRIKTEQDAITKAKNTAKSATHDSASETASDLSQIKSKYEDIIASLKEYQSEQEGITKELERQNSYTEALAAKNEAIAKARKEYISGALDQYLNGLKEEATLAEKQNAIIEKRKALEEALQALEDAKNQRNVRVLNPDGTLGGWQANKKDVKNAQDRVEQATKNVNSAVESLNDYLKNTAIAEIKQKIEAGSASESEIRDILAKWLGLGEGDTAALNAWADGVANTFVTAFNAVKSDNSPILLGISGVQSAIEKLAKAEDAQKQYFEQKMFDEVYAALSSGDAVSSAKMRSILEKYSNTPAGRESIAKIAEVVSNAMGADIYAIARSGKGQFFGGLRPSDKETISLYDNGGVLSGIGGIKATREDEIVIDPALTRQILNPQYNKRYEDFVAANRLLFGDSRHIPAANMVRTVNNTSSNDQRSYTINGVPIPQRVAKEYTIEQVFNNMSLFKQ